MPNHLHMIYSVADGKDPALVLKNIKSFTALKIIDAIINNPQESRKGWMLDLFEKNGKATKNNFRFPRLTGRAGILATRKPFHLVRYK